MAAPASGRAASQHGGLTVNDKRYRPGFEDLSFLKGKKVLDIGPGLMPFPAATEFVEWTRDPRLHGADKMPELPGPVHYADLCSDPLPFPDKSFDFIVCRHVLEDMFNPFLLVREMSRVGLAGYIECPSPLVELCRGVDVGSPAYRGYHHHRFLVWNRAGVLTFVSKYPVIEHYSFDDQLIAQELRADPKRWNTMFAWRDEIKFKHMQNPIDFYMPTDYYKLLGEAMECA